MISERDYNNILATAREEGLKMGYEEGREKGRAQGFEEGREEERLDLARKMKNRGISISEISIITGIDKKVIEEL